MDPCNNAGSLSPILEGQEPVEEAKPIPILPDAQTSETSSDTDESLSGTTKPSLFQTGDSTISFRSALRGDSAAGFMFS